MNLPKSFTNKTGDTLMEMYCITRDKLTALIEDSNRLQALECWGVDSWSGYDEAFSEYGPIEATEKEIEYCTIKETIK